MTRETAFWCLVLVLGVAWGARQWLQPAVPLDTHAHETPDYLVPGGPRTLTRIEIERGGHLHRYVRGTNDRWMVEPVTHPESHGGTQGDADDHDHDRGHHGRQAAAALASPDIEALLRTTSVMRIERRLGPPGSDLAAFGLDRPVLSFCVFSSRMPSGAPVAVGGGTPDGFGRYALEASSGELMVLPGYQVENLVTLSNGEQGP